MNGTALRVVLHGGYLRGPTVRSLDRLPPPEGRRSSVDQPAGQGARASRGGGSRRRRGPYLGGRPVEGTATGRPARRGPAVTSVLMVAVAVLVVLAVGPRASPSAAGTVVVRPASSTTGLGVRQAILTSADASVPAGAEVVFELNLTATACYPGAPANETIERIVFQPGDGSRFSVSPTVVQPSCRGAPWNASVPITYSYASAGTFDASATVTWTDGNTVTSTPVTLNVTPATDPVGTTVLWTVGFLAATAVGTAGAVVVLRRRLPPPPGLSPAET